MWKLKLKTNEQTKEKQTHGYREQTGGCQTKGWAGWVKQVKGIER